MSRDFWAGLRPYTDDHLPFIGPGPLPGLFLATGHFRNGILLTPITARLVAESVLGRKTAVDLAPVPLESTHVPALNHVQPAACPPGARRPECCDNDRHGRTWWPESGASP